MRSEIKSSSNKSNNKRLIIISSAVLLILFCLAPLVIFKNSTGNEKPPTLVMRVDDIQDFAFREAQLFLLNESMMNQVPLSLAIIAGMFGEDREIVRKVREATVSGSEVTVHGWEHENFAELSFEEQATLLSKSSNRIREVLDIDAEVFVPPMFGFNESTILAMHRERYNIISTSTECAEPGYISDVVNIPATVELSDYSHGNWTMKGSGAIKAEISSSIEKYGFAVVVTHPQEFISGNRLNPVAAESYRTLLTSLKESYSFGTLKTLGENLEIQP